MGTGNYSATSNNMMSVHFMIFMSKFKEAEVKEQLIIVSLMDVGFLRIASSLASKSYTTDCPTGTSASRRIQKNIQLCSVLVSPDFYHVCRFIRSYLCLRGRTGPLGL